MRQQQLKLLSQILDSRANFTKFAKTCTQDFIHLQQNEVCDGSSKGILFLDSSEMFFKVPAVTPLYLPERIFGGGGVDKTSDCSADVC